MALLYPPDDLRFEGMSGRIFSDAPNPLFGWTPRSPARFAQIQVEENGDVCWDTGILELGQPSMTYSGPALQSRSTYRWHVRTGPSSEELSEWSEWFEWEAALINAEDWIAKWIARAVPGGHRPSRSIGNDRIDWVEAHHELGQTFASLGLVTGVSVNLTSERVDGLECELSVRDTATGRVLGRRKMDWLPGDRFSHWIGFDPPLPPGNYQAVISGSNGRIGWLTAEVADGSADDGVSPLGISGIATQDRKPVDGTRCLGVEVEPAANPRFEREFYLSEPARRARLYGVGLGYGKFSMNGVEIADIVLEPAPTMYDRRILYRIYDVTNLLRQGKNTIGAILGRGFYSARGVNVWGFQLAPWNREPCMIAQLEIELESGRIATVVSGEDWSCGRSEVAREMLLGGETNDGRQHELVERAIEVSPPGGRLMTANIAPITRSRTLAPATVSQRPNGSQLYDFGSTIAGWTQAQTIGSGVLEIKYAETLDEAGDAYCENVLSHGEAQRDQFIRRDDRIASVVEPCFGYKGFRYAQVRTTGDLRVTNLAGVQVHTQVNKAGSFSCSSETLTWIDDALGRTFVNNLHGIPTDTPIYEKNGWTADAHLVGEALLHQFDLHAVYRKWLRDHADAQSEDGTIPMIVPTPGWGRDLDPAWSASYPLLLWNVYFEYGDLQILEEHVEGVLRYIRRMHKIAKPAGWIWPGHSWGDWLSPGYGLAPEGSAPTATAMMARSTGRAAMICDALGRVLDAAQLREAGDQIREAYNTSYFDEATGDYRSPVAGYRQSLNVLALAFGLVDPSDAKGVASSLARDVSERCANHLDVGAVAVKHLLPMLSSLGYHDVALKVAEQPTRPGWGVWKDAGSDTLWEHWDAHSRSRNHYFLGSVAQWLHEDVAGLVPLEPGWRKFKVAPKLTPNGISSASIYHRSVRGDVGLEWRIDDDRFAMNVMVPTNSVAELSLEGVESVVVEKVMTPGETPILLPPGVHRVEGRVKSP